MDTVWTGVLIGAGALLTALAINQCLHRWNRKKLTEETPMLGPRMVRHWRMRSLVIQQ